MNGLANYVLWLWEFSVAIQVAVCSLLFFNGNFRRIPFFTLYVISNILQAALVFAAYSRLGFLSRSAGLLAWMSQAVPQLLRVFAMTEVIRLILRPYRGIWGLGWRLLTIAFGSVFLYALVDSWNDIQWAIGLADRGFHLAFGVALVACLLLIRYYAIPIHPAYKTILAGFCFYSCTIVLANTIGRTLSIRGISDFGTGWQLLSVGTFVVVLIAWGSALRARLPEAEPEVESQAAEATYWQLSPRINDRLRLLNDELCRFWKPEATRH